MFHNRVYSHCCLCFWFAYSRNGQAGRMLAVVQICCNTSFSPAELIKASQFISSGSLPLLWRCAVLHWERAQLPTEMHTEKLYLVYIQPSAFKPLALTPQVGEVIWLPCVWSRKNLRCHLFCRGLRLPSVYLKTSACLTNTNMQLGFPGTHYLTLWYMPRG